MEIVICKDYDEVSKKTSDFIIAFLSHYKVSQLCFATGETPIGTFRYLVKAVRQGFVRFDGSKFVSLDEWVGINGKEFGSCRNIMDIHFFDPLSIEESNIYFFDGQAKNLEKECAKINSYLTQNGPLDLVLLGLGLNGHIGFNEPGTSTQSLSHLATLDFKTREVGQKYFKKQMDLSLGLTLGLKQIMEARVVVLLACGKKKAKIVKSVLEDEISETIPATILKRHPNCHLFLDRSSYSEVRDSSFSK